MSRLVSKQITPNEILLFTFVMAVYYALFSYKNCTYNHQTHECAHIYTVLPSPSTFRNNSFIENVTHDGLYFNNFKINKGFPLLLTLILKRF